MILAQTTLYACPLAVGGATNKGTDIYWEKKKYLLYSIIGIESEYFRRFCNKMIENYTNHRINDTIPSWLHRLNTFIIIICNSVKFWILLLPFSNSLHRMTEYLTFVHFVYHLLVSSFFFFFKTNFPNIEQRCHWYQTNYTHTPNKVSIWNSLKRSSCPNLFTELHLNSIHQ